MTLTQDSGTRLTIPRDYEMFAGLDVDKHSIAVTFRNPDASA